MNPKEKEKQTLSIRFRQVFSDKKARSRVLIILAEVIGLAAVIALGYYAIRTVKEGSKTSETAGDNQSEQLEEDIEDDEPDIIICSSDNDCSDDDPYTNDVCIDEGTEDSYCIATSVPSQSSYYDYCWDYDCTDRSVVPWPKKSISSQPDIVRISRPIKATGILTVGIAYLYTDDVFPQELLDVLNADSTEIRSFSYAEKWFEEQADDYNISFDIQLTFSQPQKVEPGESGIYNYQGYIDTNMPEIVNKDIQVAFVYSPIDKAPRTSSSGEDISIAAYYVPGYQFGIDTSTLYSRNLAHEIAHSLGVQDKYTCINEDVNSPECAYAVEHCIGCLIESSEPQNEQTGIMCHRVAVYRNEVCDGFIMPDLNELYFDIISAKEIGWVDMDGDTIPEVNDPCPYLKDNNCSENN